MATVSIEGTNAPAPYVPADKPIIDSNMTLGQLHRSRAPIGWLTGGMLNLLLWYRKKKSTADLNLLFVHNMPLRAIAKMTGDMVSMGVINGLVMELKGFWIIGLCKAGYELGKNLVLNTKQMKQLKY